MCCVITALVFLGPRIGIIVWYIIDPARWQAVFDSLLLPILGFLLLPWTTLAYVLLGVDGLSTLDWIFMAVALLIDVSAYGGGGYGNRKRIRRVRRVSS
jgi:hypothetical protein